MNVLAAMQKSGVPVNVGDEFLKLSPEQQNATVDEIHQSMNKLDLTAMPKSWQGPEQSAHDSTLWFLEAADH